MKKIFQLLLTFSFFVWVPSLTAQPNYPAPTGVWCSCPPTTGSGNGSVDPAVASKSYVKGILLRVAWKDIETTDNIYNWSLIDNQLSSAQSFGKKISLAIGGGPNTPAWLYTAGAQSITYTVPFTGTIPIPWDTVFLSKWTDFIVQLGNRYANNNVIQLVYITNSSGNGFEMQLPFNPSPSYSTLGYTDQKMIDAWKKVINTFNSSFPNHYLSNDFHPVNSSNAVADSVYAYAKLKIGTRYGANGWWWTQNNTSVYPAQFNILKNSALNNQFTGIQMAYSGSTSSASFGIGGMPTALNLAISNHICYWEIWNNDITAGTFDTLLSDVTCNPLAINLNGAADQHLKIYPNPTQSEFYVSPEGHDIQKIEIVDQLGSTILVEDKIQNMPMRVNIQTQKPGCYFLKIIYADGSIIFKTITKIE